MPPSSLASEATSHRHLTSSSMDKRSCRLQQETTHRESEEVSSKEWEFIHMSEQEEDLIRRMYRLVGDRWGLVAGRIPGRKAEEIERYWIMRHGESFAEKRQKREAGEGGRCEGRRAP